MEFGGSKFLHSLILGSLLLLCLDLITCVMCKNDSTSSSSWTFNIPDVSFLSFSPVYSSSQNHHIALSFRTRQSKGVIFCHYLKDLDREELDRINYKLSGELRHGTFVLTYQLMQYRDSLTVGEALNNDEWHSMDVVVNTTSGELILTVDGVSDKTYIRTYIGQDMSAAIDWSTQASAIYYGGTDPNTLFTREDTLPHFTGCMRDIRYLNKDGGFVPVPLQMMEGVKQGCEDLCVDNPCHKGGHCINNYTNTICDCFGTDYQGKYCSDLGPATVTLRGYEWITYSMYEEYEDMIAILTERSRFSMEFKTSRGSGVLLYAVGGAPYHSHVTASVHDGVVRVAMGIGDHDVEIDAGISVSDFRWHNLTIVHYKRSLKVYLDAVLYEREITGEKYLLSLDPKVFIGGGDNFVVTRGLQVTQNFVGCLKNVYVNEVSVLYAMSENKPSVDYDGAGSTQPHFGCEEVVNIPISFPSSASNLVISTTEEMKYGFDIEFDFKTVRSEAILFYANLINQDTSIEYNFGFIEVSVRNGRPTLLFVPSTQHPERTHNASIPTIVNNNTWYSLQIAFKNNQARLKVQGLSILSTMSEQTLIVRDMIMIGYGLRKYKESEGFVGCIRNLKVQGEILDALDLMENKRAVTGLRIDGCNITDYCKDNRMCEHGGKCLSEWEGVTCDCSETAYTGRACHFPKYKRSCNEYYQSGVNDTEIMIIDLDGNGDMEPVYVKCEMGYEDNYEFFGKTIIDHNLEKNTKIRGYLMADMRKIISYRNMDRQHLIQLTNQSAWCEQYIQYDCKQAPIRLSTSTWFKSANEEMVEYLGTEDAGHCTCSLTDSCIGDTCNCDNGSLSLQQDSGYNRVKDQLPLTEITIKQNYVFEKQAGANISLGPLVCWGNKNQLRQNAVTFGTEASYLQTHPWKTGPLRISFRTHSDRALVLYQSGTNLNTNYFLVAVTSASAVKFYFRWGRYKLEFDMKTQNPINNGQWHQIEIDHDHYNIRCMVDMREKILNVPQEVPKVTTFSGILYIGGTPDGFDRDPIVQNIPGLVGCMRGLVYNYGAQPLNQLRDPSTVDVKEQCMASCWPNPCRNGATCVEEWGPYKCDCINKWAHSGHNCETDINQDAVTFLGHADSYLQYKVPPPDNLLDSSIIFSFRTFQQSALLLYLHDNLYNFVQVELQEGRKIVASFNVFQTISSQSKTVEGLSDGQWKQVVINNTDGYIKVIVDVDDEHSRHSYKKRKLVSYNRKPFIGTQTVIPNRPRQKPEDMIHVFVGSVPYKMTLSPLSGCLRGLKVGEKVFPLQQKARISSSVSDSCEDGCADRPCKNGGLCLEQFQNRQFECDCTDSEFAGTTCETEASGDFRGETILQYQFDTPNHAKQTVTERLELVFQVDKDVKDDMILAFIYSERYFTHDFLIVYLDPQYGIFIQTNQGYAKYGVSKPGRYADGRPHHLLYKRTNSEMLLTVDEEGIGRVTVPDNPLDELDTIMLGGILNSQFSAMRRDIEDYIKYSNFTGCMSEVKFYPSAERPFFLRPLKDLRDNRSSSGNVTIYGADLDICQTRLKGDVTTTQAPVVTWKTVTHRPQLTLPPWNPGPAKTILTGKPPELPSNKTTTAGTTPSTTAIKSGGKVYESVSPGSRNDKKIMMITLAIVALLLIIAIVIAIILVRMRRRQQREAEKKKKIKEAEELEMKQPLNDDAIMDNHQNQHYLAKLDEFSMVSASLGVRKADNMSTFKPPPNEDGYTPVPTSEDPAIYRGQQFYNRKKNRPASSISEVLEEMERQKQIKEADGGTNDLEITEGQGIHHVGDGSWDPEPVRTPLSCPNEDFRQMPIPEDLIYTVLPPGTLAAPSSDTISDEEPVCDDLDLHCDSLDCTENQEDDQDNDADNESENASPLNEFHHSHEYNGDSGYEAESKPDEEEEETLMNGSFHGEATPHSPESQTFNVYSEEVSPHSLDSKNMSDRMSADVVFPVRPDNDILQYSGTTPVTDGTSTPKTSFVAHNGENT